ncbi:hypothetical protein [Streptomyces microflavus]|uniref:hypothetical protein n=1 Tax=Streptomyces microflavus TaxID=1919 RepID=UPI00365F915F
MDPGIIAAIVTTPTAVLAAAAAYAAGRVQGRSARDAATTAARSVFEEQAREAQRSAYVSFIGTAHAAGERLEVVLERAIEAVSEDSDAMLLYGVDPQRRRNDVRMNFLPTERAAFSTALARVELEGPKHLILLARRVGTAIRKAEEDCSTEFRFLVARHQFDKAIYGTDAPFEARKASRALGNLTSVQTPSLTPSQRVTCVSFLLSPRDRDISMPARGRDEQAASLQAAHPEECEALLLAYTEVVNHVGRVVTDGLISQSVARTLKLRAVRGREAQLSPFNPWDQIHRARVEFTDAARDYLHAVPSAHSAQ